MRGKIFGGAVLTLTATLALALTAAATSTVYWSGTTSQRAATGKFYGFSLTVGTVPNKHGTYVTSFACHANFTGAGTQCAKQLDGGVSSVQYRIGGFSGIKITNNKFSDSRAPQTVNDHVAISGSFKHGKLTGTFVESFRGLNPQQTMIIHCSTGRVKFTATKVQ